MNHEEALGRYGVLTCEIDGATSAVGLSSFGSFVFGAEPRGKRFFDVNGDGLDDFQSAYGHFVAPTLPLREARATLLNDGGRFEFIPRREFDIPKELLFEQQLRSFSTPLIENGRIISASATIVQRDRGVRMMDVNGDGVTDLVVATDPGAIGTVPSRRIYLGTQSPANPWRLLPQTSPFQIPPEMSFVIANGRDRGVRSFDANGDRLTDLIQVYLGTRRAFMSTAVVPDLLEKATSPLGGSQAFEYTTSALEDNPTLRINMPIVKSITMDPGLPDATIAPPVVTTFDYAGGLYDYSYPGREFRGFRMVRPRRAADGRVSEMLFHQDIGRAGLVERMVMKDAAGHLLVESETSTPATTCPVPRSCICRSASARRSIRRPAWRARRTRPVSTWSTSVSAA
jgi:hypothetical protein